MSATAAAAATTAAVEDRLDRLVNLDMGGRGVEALYRAAREKLGRPLVGAAAEALLAVPEGATVLLTTGSVTRAWVSAEIAENDGPAGAAVIARALALSRRAVPVLLVEASIRGPIGQILMAAGLSLVTMAEAARAAAPGGRLALAVLQDYPLEDAAGLAAAEPLLEALAPALLFSTERVGRNRDGIYCNMRGVEYGQGRARVDHVFDAALRRGIPVVAVGDGGNEIGMGLVPEAVAQHVPHGAHIGAVTAADVLVTAACSNWGCYAIAAAMARRAGDPRLLHTPEQEARLLLRGVEVGLLNSVDGLIDPNVDGIPLAAHQAMVELIRTIARPG